MVQGLFGAINVVIPTQIPYYFGLFFSYARLGDGIFPMSDVMLALFTILSVWIGLYIIKIVLWALRVIPFVGRLGGLPRHSMSTTTTESTTEISSQPGWSKGGMKETRSQTKRTSK